jgi:hypothetical protein
VHVHAYVLSVRVCVLSVTTRNTDQKVQIVLIFVHNDFYSRAALEGALWTFWIDFPSEELSIYDSAVGRPVLK